GYIPDGESGPMRLGRGREPAHARLPRRGVGTALARRAAPVRDADPRGRPGRPVVGDDPQQARGLPEGVRRVRPGRGRALRRPEGRTADGRPGDRPQPREDRSRDRQRPCVAGASGGDRLGGRAPVVVRRRSADRSSRPVPLADPRGDRRVPCDEPGAQATRVPLRRADDLLRVHAGGWHGERSHALLLPTPRASTATLDLTRSRARRRGRRRGPPASVLLPPGRACHNPPVTERAKIGEIRYARSGGIAIAYQVIGHADVDLVYVPDYVSNLEFGWEHPRWRAFYKRLARRFRLILFDKRGTGLSDHGAQFATLETRMEDLRAVLDAVGSTRTVVFGAHEGCGMAALFAATYPERTRALVLFHPAAKGPGTDDPQAQRELSELREGWGTQAWCDALLREGCPSLYDSEEERRQFARELRVGASPAVAYALNRAFYETDLREVLPAVRVPTLVLYRRGRYTEEPDALDVAARISGARAMRVSGSDYFGIFLSLDIADEIERFVAGEEAPQVPETVLTTVLFTDLVGSTELASALGDHAWGELLSEHHALVRRELSRFRGQERDTAGDGFFATFDGPAR